MKANIFREYDIRGIVGTEFTIEESYNLAKSIITYFLQEDPSIKTIALGYDGRVHTPQIKNNVIKAITEMGINVVDIGLCPSPTFYFVNHSTEFTSGIMITASHNPGQYNGFKVCLNKKMIYGQEIQKIYKIYLEQNFKTGYQPGKLSSYNSVEHYINWLVKNFSHLKDPKAIIDCANATGGVIIPKILKRMGWNKSKVLFDNIDGTFPNHPADPTVIKNMLDVKEKLTSEDFKVGIGLDGDCDRMTPMTPDGYLVPGDKLLSIFSKQVLENNPGAAVVFDIKSSLGLIEALKSMGGKPCIAPSGHSLIKNEMVKTNALLAGELSCHFFFKDRYFGYDDGIYAMMRLFEISQTSKPLEELLLSFPKKVSSKEFRVACPEEKKNEIINGVKDFFSAKQCDAILNIDGIRAQMSYGWGLARASNTQPVISLRFEAETADDLKRIKSDFAEALTPYFDEEKIKDEIEL